MASLNKVFLMGNLTRDPELRYSGGGAGGGGGGGGGGGSAICKFGLAVNREWRDQAGNKQEETTFVDITVFGRQAETSNEYLKKGRPVFIEGRLNFSTWEDRETHQKRSKLDVVAERVQFLGSAQRDGDGGGSGGGGGGGGYRGRSDAGAGAGPGAGPSGPSGGGAPRGGNGGNSGGGARPSGPAEGVDFDDIPF